MTESQWTEWKPVIQWTNQTNWFFLLSYSFLLSFLLVIFFHFPIWFPWCFHVALVIVVVVNVFLFILNAIDVLVVKTAIMVIVPVVICCSDACCKLNTLIQLISYWFNSTYDLASIASNSKLNFYFVII